MNDPKRFTSNKLDTNEFDLPETTFIRDIDNRVFQGIVVQCLSKIEGVTLLEGSFISNIFGRNGVEGIKGIHTEQDNKHQCISIRLEVNVNYGISIPEKAEEIQSKVTSEITALTGLHVSSVHVVFKGITTGDSPKKLDSLFPASLGSSVEEEYSDEF